MQPTADNIFYVLAHTLIKKTKTKNIQSLNQIKSNNTLNIIQENKNITKWSEGGGIIPPVYQTLWTKPTTEFPKQGVKTPRINTKRWRRKKKRSVFYAPIPLRSQKDTKITINPSPVMSSCILTISLNRILVYFWEVWVTTKMLNITATAGSFTQLFRAPEW